MSALCGDGKNVRGAGGIYLADRKRTAIGRVHHRGRGGDFCLPDAASVTSPPGSATPVKAWAYRGKPLYTFIDDEAPGDTLGDWITYFSRSSFDAVLVPGPGIY